MQDTKLAKNSQNLWLFHCHTYASHWKSEKICLWIKKANEWWTPYFPAEKQRHNQRNSNLKINHKINTLQPWKNDPISNGRSKSDQQIRTVNKIINIKVHMVCWFDIGTVYFSTQRTLKIIKFICEHVRHLYENTSKSIQKWW